MCNANQIIHLAERSPIGKRSLLHVAQCLLLYLSFASPVFLAPIYRFFCPFEMQKLSQRFLNTQFLVQVFLRVLLGRIGNTNVITLGFFDQSALGQNP